MSGWFTSTVNNGSMLLALPVALFAGLASFLSPCVIPMLPGYLSYATGLSGADLAQGSVRRSRMFLGSLLFVLGFGVVFVTLGVAVGNIGWLTDRHHARLVQGVFGGIVILLGLSFMGVVPILQRDWRFHRIPSVGLLAAPLLGFLFGLGWTPCMGPTLGTISILASQQGSSTRGGILLGAYALGLGIPFILMAVLWRQALHALKWLRRHQIWVTRIGGLMMIAVGILLATGAWTSFTQWMQIHVVTQWQGVAV